MTKASLSWECVLQALELVQNEAKRLGVDPHHLAEKKRAEEALAGDYIGARVWRDVWVCLMTQKYLPATLRIHEPTLAEQNRSEGLTKH